MTAPVVIGLDLSLTATGVAREDIAWLVTTKHRGMERLAFIQEALLDAVDRPLGVDVLVCIEGYSMGSARQQSHAHALGELGGVVRLALWEHGVPYLDVPPATLKTYATGRGIAKKVEVIIAARERLGYDGSDDNICDAIWLRALGLDLLGHPLVKLPQSHRRALDKLTLPEAVTS